MTPRHDGIFVALWSPTDADGRLRETDLTNNLDWLVEQGVHGIMALGSTGEFLHLEIEQRKRVLALAVANQDELPVLANISDLRPRVVAELGGFAREIGAAAVSVLPPHFYAVAQPDLVEFFVRAGEAAHLPLYLYNYPERTGNRLSLETIAAVADRIPLAGIKQSGGEFDYHRHLVQLGREKNFVVFTGSDARLPEAMALGVVGCVSGLANAVPEFMADIFEAIKAGTPEHVTGPVEFMRAMGILADQLEFPLNVAAAMQARGLAVGEPKAILSSTTRARYLKLVANFEHLYRAWKLI